MQTLADITSGKLNGISSFKLSCNLTQFPDEIFDLADSLEILDLSGNQLNQLPERFKEFKKLKIAFFSDNCFTEFPEILQQCEQLEMISFKSNQLSIIAENTIPVKTRWLILTNNYLTTLPTSLGKCYRLQKVALAGNQLKSLPTEMTHCKNIQLLRISANQLITLPTWLLQLPKLAWLACAANLFNDSNILTNNLPEVNWLDIEIKELLGQGASGMIYKATYQANDVAVKIFKGEVTSDGLPYSEMQACIKASTHQNIISVIGEIKNHPDSKNGLMMNLLNTDYTNLGMPPNFETCTRDTFNKGITFNLNQILHIIKNICDAMLYLHQNGIMHGDLYAHNILINAQNHAILGDFGAATLYDTNSKEATLFEKIDVKAFGFLIDDLLQHLEVGEQKNKNHQLIDQIKENCLLDDIDKRPLFKNLNNDLKKLIL